MMKEVNKMVVIDKLTRSKILETIVDELDWRVALWNSLKKETEEAGLLDLPRESSIKKYDYVTRWNNVFTRNTNSNIAGTIYQNQKIIEAHNGSLFRNINTSCNEGGEIMSKIEKNTVLKLITDEINIRTEYLDSLTQLMETMCKIYLNGQYTGKTKEIVDVSATMPINAEIELLKDLYSKVEKI